VNAPRELRLGLMRDMPAEDYHATQAMSAGGLKRMRQSPAHFYGIQLDPNRPESGEPTAAMANGNLVHCALFEPDQVDARYVVKPDGMSFSSKEGKAWKEAQTRTIVDAEAMAKARAQAAAVRAVPDLAALLAEGYGEASCFWIDEETGELCKCRPDWTSPAGDGVILTDGKTCRDASPEGFGRAIWNLGYHLAAAWYSDGFEKATGQRVHGFVFAAVESDWPHVAMPYMLGDDVLAAARREYRRLLNRYAECKRTGVWPGYGSAVQLINLPKWANLEGNEQ
jgi:exodeoxyribonuclease VIII